MEFDGILACLAGSPGSDTQGRFVAVDYRWDLADEVFVVGEASSLSGALDLLAANLVEVCGGDLDALIEACHYDLDEDEQAYERWLTEPDRPLAGTLRRIGSRSRRLLAYYFLGYLNGPFTLRTSDSSYLGGAADRLPGAEFVFVADAAPPHQQEACGVLAWPPAGRGAEDQRISPLW
jgi:hypothetical protein